MTLLLILLTSSIVLCIGAFMVAHFYLSDFDHDWPGMVSAAIGTFAGIAAIIFIVCIPIYFGAGIKAEIINSKYDTHYTRDQMFWGGSTIMNYIQGSKTNINGDITIHKGN